MIAHLSGVVARIESTFVVIDVGGVGYKVSVPVPALTALSPVGTKAFLHINTQVREDDIALYGFTTTGDAHVFAMLLGVSGVGPKVALSVLSGMNAFALAKAVAADDTRTLTRVPGLGPKTAQRLVLELKEKLAIFALEHRADEQQPDTKAAGRALADDVVEGLVNLGYHRNDARKAADRAFQEITDKADMGVALRAALNILTGGSS